MTIETRPYFTEVREGEEPIYTFRTLRGDEDENVYERLGRLARLAGKDYLIPRYLRAWATLTHVWVFRREEDKRILGFLTAEPLSSIEVLEWNRYLSPDKRVHVQPPTLYLGDLVIDPDHRRLGAASTMVRHVVENGERYGDNAECYYDRAYTISRLAEKPAANSYKLLMLLGWFEVVRISGYYQNLEKWFCHVCDPLREGHPCNCLGVLMEWRRREE